MRELKRADLQTARARWVEAQRFKVGVRRLLKREKVSFTQWMVLETVDELQDPHGNFQCQVAEALCISERVASYTIHALQQRELLERDAEDSPYGWNVALTREGKAVLARCREILAEAVRNYRLASAMAA
jgi:DNA-binding MarR family transcriptional regulator